MVSPDRLVVPGVHVVRRAARRAPLIPLVLAIVAAPFIGAAPSTAASSHGDGPTAQRTARLEFATPLTHTARHDRLTRVARTHGMSVGKVRDLLTDDPTVHIGPDDRLVYVDKARSAPGSQPLRTGSQALTVPLEETFRLHSNPAAGKKIYLDVDGATVTDTVWNQFPYNLPSGTYGGWDPSSDGESFNDAELAMIQEVWERVAEDYAPFDVDITTENPGAAGLARTDASDTGYGVRALITSDPAPPTAFCSGGCDGLAQFGVFDSYTEESKIAWIMPPASLPTSAVRVAEVASHEVGHTLGLRHDGQREHDGQPRTEYYSGHGFWAPIMGDSVDGPLSQWSNGQYAHASNQEDDVAIIKARLGFRPDEAGGTILSSAPLGSGHGYITRRTDADMYELGICSGALDLAAVPAATGPNLDIRLELVAADGVVLANDDPVASDTGDGTVSGLAARLATSGLPHAEYFVRVDGVGIGSPATAYDDYGSLGEYTLTRTGSCDPSTLQKPSAPQSLVAQTPATLHQITVTWEPPATPGTSPVEGYRLAVDDGTAPIELPNTARSYTFTNLLASTTYGIAVTAFSTAGDGTAATVNATTPIATVPTPVQAFTAVWQADGVGGGYFLMTWEPPADSGGTPITGYVITGMGGMLALPATRRVVFVSPPRQVVHGEEIPLSIEAKNVVGSSAPVEAIVLIDLQPPVASCDTPAPVFALNQESGAVTGRLIDETDPVTRTLSGAPDTSSITNTRTVVLYGSDTAENQSNLADCVYTVAAGFGGYRSPLPKTTLRKSTASIPVKFTLTDAAGPLTSTVSAQLAADGLVRVVLTGPALNAPSAAPCTWNARAGNFECVIKTSNPLVGGLYQITAQEKGMATSDTFFTVPGASSTSIQIK